MSNIKLNQKHKKILAALIVMISVTGSFFHIFISFNTSISIVQQRVFHVFIMILLYYILSIKKRKENNQSYFTNIILSSLTFLIFIYYMLNTNFDAMMKRGIHGSNNLDIIVGVILIFLILDIARRTIGWALASLSIIALLYAYFGPFMPEIIAHKGYSIHYITNYLAWTTESIFGSPIGASVSFVALYIIFGELLEKFGAGKFFIDLAYALTGRIKGGPAEAAVVSSALMGSINGSAVANVVTTGTFTIPLMKKVGYSSEFSGAVEAVASTGGQLLPPVMGAAAFVMADITGIPYSNIIIAAIIPGILYYLSLAISVYLEAHKLGIEAEDKKDLPILKDVFKNGWYHSIPIIVLIVALIKFGMSPNYSALYAIISLITIGTIKEIIIDKKLPIKQIYLSLVKATQTTISVAIACACAGIVIGIVGMTGIGIKFTKIVFDISNGNLFMMLFMIMISCIIMGMGLPSTAAYIITATIGVPALIKAGIPTISAHLFVFYFAIISFITPPVAMSAYAASGIAGSDTNKTGILAFLLGLPGFIIPFIYVYKPELLIINHSTPMILYTTITSIISIVIISLTISGWLINKIKLHTRILMGISAILLLMVNWKYNLLGLIIFAFILIFKIYSIKKEGV